MCFINYFLLIKLLTPLLLLSLLNLNCGLTSDKNQKETEKKRDQVLIKLILTFILSVCVY